MMGKVRKHSRGMSAGFVPGYTQAGETMIDPNEFGYSHGIDSEMDESPALKRSRVSLNGDSYGVPKEVLSLSKMSRSERKHLVQRLRMELEQVKDLRKKIACFSSDTVLLSPYSDIHCCSDGPRKPPQENFATFAGSQGKQRHPVRNDKQRTKKGPSRHSESLRLDDPTSSAIASLMKECEALHQRLRSHKKAWPFQNPVDPVSLNIPDYFTVIKHPMDFGTISSRLRQGEYSSPFEFAADVRLTLSNSMAYNPPGNDYHKMAQVVSKYFESKWKIIEKKVPVIKPPVMPLTSTGSLESDIPFEVAPPRKKAAVVNESKLRVEPAKLVMTDDEKRKLSRDLEALEEEFPQNIIDLLREQTVSAGQTGEVEIEIDIDTLSDEILFMVRKLLDDHLREKKKSQEKSEPCEMEIVHDSGFSNSPMQPSKGDLLLIDEDVDIVGGNDPPVSSHPPLKIEKDAACRNNECSSSSSSSSESGSSSSDSDSCSSSGSETDSIKASKPTSTEGKKESGVGINRNDDDSNGEKIVVNDSLNELGQVELDVGEKSMAMDAVDVLPYEETAPPERQLSPDKRYRAALLKNRFADTIMKAREKALPKGEKGDPEKLRIEREEFEKRLKEEKLRLQAEAKAAEEARRKAEAEAAEKARKEREQEREAARQALQKMEKTVEINEGRRFMEDLEMLRATGGESDQLPTFMVEMSPKFSEDMLGSFKIEGNSNPLEQLGLYMKMDDDEDDEDDQPHFSQEEVKEQHHPLDRSERQTLSPQEKEEGEYQVGSGNEGREGPVSQKAQDNGNQEDDAHGNGNKEDEKLINPNEGDEQMENVPEQETEFVDKAEEETKVFNKGEEEMQVVDMCEEENEVVVYKGEQETVVVGKGEQVTDIVDMEEQETEVLDKGEQETEVVDMEEQETEVLDKREQETELVGNGEQETEVVGNGEEETKVVCNGEEETKVVGIGEHETDVYMGEEETEVVDKREQETKVGIGEHEPNVVDVGEEETEVVDKRELETQVVDMEEPETQVVDMEEQKTQVVDMEEQGTKVGIGEHETNVVDMGEEETEVVDKRELETQVVDMEEPETQVVDMEEQKTEVVDMEEQKTEVVDMEEQGTQVVDMEEQGTDVDVVDKREEETEVVDNGEQGIEVVVKRDQEIEVVDNEEQGTEVVDKRDQEIEVVDNGEQGTEVVDKRDQDTEVVDKRDQDTEVVDKREQETEVVDNGDHETKVLDKREQETEVLDNGDQDIDVVID